MKLFIALMLLGSAAFAAKPAVKTSVKPANKPVYKVAMDMSIDGIKHGTTLTVQEGKLGSIESVTENRGGIFQEVTVTKTVLEGKPALHMDFVVGEVDRFGNKSVIATPKIISSVGEKSTVIMGSAAGGKKLIFSALAKSVAK